MSMISMVQPRRILPASGLTSLIRVPLKCYFVALFGCGSKLFCYILAPSNDDPIV